jgi:hypothetical protein
MVLFWINVTNRFQGMVLPDENGRNTRQANKSLCNHAIWAILTAASSKAVCYVHVLGTRLAPVQEGDRRDEIVASHGTPQSLARHDAA